MKCAAVEAAGWLETLPQRPGAQWVGLFLCERRASQSCQAHPEEAREPSWGTAQAELGHWPGGRPNPNPNPNQGGTLSVLRHLARELEQPNPNPNPNPNQAL